MLLPSDTYLITRFVNGRAGKAYWTCAHLMRENS